MARPAQWLSPRLVLRLSLQPMMTAPPATPELVLRVMLVSKGGGVGEMGELGETSSKLLEAEITMWAAGRLIKLGETVRLTATVLARYAATRGSQKSYRPRRAVEELFAANVLDLLLGLSLAGSRAYAAEMGISQGPKDGTVRTPSAAPSADSGVRRSSMLWGI